MAEAEQFTIPQASKGDSPDKRAQLVELIERAAAKDAAKDHNSASELYSQATELQAELNGELSSDNADILYAYGKSLYNVAVSKSDVLGSKVAGEQPQGLSSHAGQASATSTGPASAGEGLIKTAISSSMAKGESSSEGKGARSEATPSKPLFQFTGDENFVDSESEEEENGDAGEEDDEEEDDFANAFEVLDLARVLYLKKLSAAEENNVSKGKSTELPAHLKHIKERLADTYDLQAEISLEAERFSDAVSDLRTALDLRNSLVPFEDPSVAECHYKLSLALEFASVQQQDEEDSDQPKTVDETMRAEAATQMERAIESCKVRMAQEEKRLDTDKDMGEDKETAAKRKIANVKEIIADMEQRLIDLRQSPVSLEQGDQGNEAMLKGILGQIVGQSTTDQKARLDAVSKSATDLSSLVRRKPAASQPSQQSSKRPAEDDASAEESKRARVNDA
ncbi:hypothetical protein N7532_003387 [Penicillium argentinense]|uniref:Tetratricopeptide SHNi-TPR domain-containing protein n=1 Tax=Penicillium argentinense TaxID=1131581 RepID=A0A9W9FMH4_9EURO|nr:uncharacterized protein N7532_003387 [Penicillium argentinense]KAJ5102858.1 hypothetical protein N7532_003387 [Penicillium argentinense]